VEVRSSEMRAERWARREVVSTLCVELMCRYMSLTDHILDLRLDTIGNRQHHRGSRFRLPSRPGIPLRLLRSREDVAGCRLGCVGLFVAGDLN